MWLVQGCSVCSRIAKQVLGCYWISACWPKQKETTYMSPRLYNAEIWSLFNSLLWRVAASLFWAAYFGHVSSLNTFILLFMLNKSLSEAWRTVSVICSSRHTGGECGQAGPRQRSWATPDDVIPSRSQKSMKTRTGTEERRRQPPSHQRGKLLFVYGHLPCGWLRLWSKTWFLCPGSRAVREGELPGEESPPRPLRPLEPGWGR